jgi:hypothetical protein
VLFATVTHRSGRVHGPGSAWTVGPNAQAVANVGDFVLSPREFRTGGLFLFVPDLVRLDSGFRAILANQVREGIK